MAKNKTNTNVAAGLFSSDKKPFPTQAVEPEAQKTQGRKGQKLPRINLAFSIVNHAYVTKTSRRQGLSITAYINRLVDADRLSLHAE